MPPQVALKVAAGGTVSPLDVIGRLAK